MSSSPHVLLITVDSLRYDVVYDDTVSTPTFDSLIDRGVDFSHAYASGPYTQASVPAIVSGTFPWRFGGYKQLTSQRPYIGDAFSQGGYSTGAFHSNPYLGSEFGYDRNFDRFFDGKSDNSRVANLRRYVTRTLSPDSLLYKLLRYLYKTGEKTLGQEIGTPYVDAEQLNERVVDWLRTTSAPSFGWVHYMDVHHPYVPHDGTVSEAVDPQRAVRLRQRMVESPEELTPDNVETLRRLYNGEIEYSDRCIGELLDAVDERWGLDETIVLFTSDHGEAFGEHGKYGHPNVMYDEVARVPLTVLSPERQPDTVPDPVSGIDILPTLLAEADVGYDRELTGIPVFEAGDADRCVFTHAGNPADGTGMVTDGTWKLIFDSAVGSVELYNLGDDPTETVDKSSERSDIVSEFEDEIDREIRATSVDETQQAKQDVSDDVKDRLRRLGYSEE